MFCISVFYEVVVDSSLRVLTYAFLIVPRLKQRAALRDALAAATFLIKVLSLSTTHPKTAATSTNRIIIPLHGPKTSLSGYTLTFTASWVIAMPIYIRAVVTVSPILEKTESIISRILYLTKWRYFDIVSTTCCHIEFEAIGSKCDSASDCQDFKSIWTYQLYCVWTGAWYVKSVFTFRARIEEAFGS